MSNAGEVFKINLNQNLWALAASFLALGLAEYYCLRTLYWFAAGMALIACLSVVVTTFAYTWKYCEEKMGS